MTKQKKHSRLTEALLESADDMRRVGVLSEQAHEKIALRRLGGRAEEGAQPISGEEIRSCASES